jgi:hypothetical protein
MMLEQFGFNILSLPEGEETFTGGNTQAGFRCGHKRTSQARERIQAAS